MMATFEIPTLTTTRLRLRAFRVSDLDAYARMQANPEVMRYLVERRPSTAAEVWRTMATSLGSGHCAAMACGPAKKSTTLHLSAALASFSRSIGQNRRSPTRSTNLTGDRGSRPKRQRRLATGCSRTSRFPGLQASFGPIITHRNASPRVSGRFAKAYSNCVVPLTNQIAAVADLLRLRKPAEFRHSR
jgi:hypothetical protein